MGLNASHQTPDNSMVGDWLNEIIDEPDADESEDEYEVDELDDYPI